MADRGQITGGILDGPLAFDNAGEIGLTLLVQETANSLPPPAAASSQRKNSTTQA